MSHWAARLAAPAPEQNEGYINAFHPITDLAAVTPVDAPAEIDTPLVPTAEVLPMPKEDKPHKKQHKKHHHKGERLPMPQEDVADGLTCPYLRQQAADRHACQFADPQVGRDVLDNLECLKTADKLLEIAEEFAGAGCIGEAMECCALAQDLCPGSPCANRAAGVLCDLYVRACEPAKHSADNQAIEKKLNQPMIVNFNNVSLRQVLDDLRAVCTINIYVDEPALAEKGISLDQPITVKAEQITFKSALNLILHSAQLVYVVKDDMVQITTEEHAHGKLMQRVYEVADLLVRKDLPKGCTAKPRKDGQTNEDCLILMITSTILPRSWSEQGGPGTIEYFPLTSSLVVNQIADVQDQIADLLAALRRLCDKEDEKKVASCSKANADSSKNAPGVEQQVSGLMKACRLLMNEGLHEQAAELARQAFAMDPERVMADPLIYKMHLLATTPGHQPAGSSEPSEPPSCPYCPKAGKPIHGIVPDKKKTKAGPTTFLVPVIPSVDYEVVPALDRVLTETAKPTAAAEETSEEDAASSLDELIETMMGGPGQSTFGFGFNGDGSLRLSGEHSCGGTVYHVLFSRGCLAIWKTPDAAKTKP